MGFETWIRDIPNFPKEGILFRDITPLLADGKAYRTAIEQLSDFARSCRAEMIVGPEARGYVVGAPLAVMTECGFAPVRKSGKLPGETIRETYSLEYGEDALEIHTDAIRPGMRVLVADDLLATGGTMQATVKLVQRLGGHVVGAAFLIELVALGGRARLEGIPVVTLVQYDG
ncbi:MAG: adenine phosphoribosyltransferase [Alicyclobacillaceae bacterium]|nr:adenine phosphoribosyltransferase [Alicyclobacillaceae bacterium]